MFSKVNFLGVVETRDCGVKNYLPCLQLIFNLFSNKPLFLRVCSTCLLKTLLEKEKLLLTNNFCFSHSVFYPFGKLSANFIKFENVVCKLFSVWKSLKLVVWERVKLELPLNVTSYPCQCFERKWYFVHTGRHS